LKTSEDAKSFISHPNDLGVLGYFPEKNTDSDNFLKAADTLREDFRFGYLTDKSIATALEISEGITIYRGEKSKVTYAKTNQLTDWIWEESILVPGEMTKDNQQRFLRTNLPILKLYLDVDWKSNLKQTSYYLNRLKKIAEGAFKNKLLFALSDKTAYADETGKYGFTTFPSVGIEDPSNSQRYKYSGEFDVAKVVEWAEQFLQGKLKSHIKSEPTPTQDGPVTIVTGETFKDIVLDETKDVLFEMYAPWCGHCKKLTPIYDELATSLKDVPNLVIAKMDATANDSPHGKYQAKGYPTIFYAPANNKNNPVAYSGGRELPAFKDFLKKNAVAAQFGAKSEL